MCYRCDNCNEVHEGTQISKITDTREVKYVPYFLKKDYKTGETYKQYLDSTMGWEIVKEAKICRSCDESLADEPTIHPNKVVEYQFIRKRVIKTERHDDKDNQKFDGGDR